MDSSSENSSGYGDAQQFSGQEFDRRVELSTKIANAVRKALLEKKSNYDEFDQLAKDIKEEI